MSRPKLRKRQSRNWKPCLECLEDRCLLTIWPIQGQVPQLLETYGQYQENSRLGLDTFVHMHEGIDIPAAANTNVVAVMNGYVEAAYSSVANPFDSFVVVRDGTRQNPGPYGGTINMSCPAPPYLTQ